MAPDPDLALEKLCETVVQAQRHLEQVLERAEVVRGARRSGDAYAEIVSESQRPLLVERLTEVLDELSHAGAAFRRAEARVLHDEGLSQDAIARLFGVSRQRVSALLKAR